MCYYTDLVGAKTEEEKIQEAKRLLGKEAPFLHHGFDENVRVKLLFMHY